MSLILSLPDDWNYSISGLSAICKESRDGIGAALKELENNLSELELSVAKHIAEGLSNNEIAELTHYSYGYIKRVVSMILEKENMKKRSDIRKFLKEGSF